MTYEGFVFGGDNGCPSAEQSDSSKMCKREKLVISIRSRLSHGVAGHGVWLDVTRRPGLTVGVGGEVVCHNAHDGGEELRSVDGRARTIAALSGTRGIKGGEECLSGRGERTTPSSVAGSCGRRRRYGWVV
jgi:hypothetical protein